MKLHDQLIDYMNYDFAAANDSSYQDGIATVNMLAHTAYGALSTNRVSVKLTRVLRIFASAYTGIPSYRSKRTTCMEHC